MAEAASALDITKGLIYGIESNNNYYLELADKGGKIYVSDKTCRGVMNILYKNKDKQLEEDRKNEVKYIPREDILRSSKDITPEQFRVLYRNFEEYFVRTLNNEIKDESSFDAYLKEKLECFKQIGILEEKEVSRLSIDDKISRESIGKIDIFHYDKLLQYLSNPTLGFYDSFKEYYLANK